MTPEGKVKNELKKQLKALGAYQFWPVQTGMGMTTVDCLVSLQGQFIAIEAKAPGKKLTARQKIVINDVRKSDGHALVIDSVDMAKRLPEILDGIGVDISGKPSTSFAARCALYGHTFRRSS